MIDLWYKDAVVYAVDVKTFQDGNGDGIGDFRGLIQRLPHIAGLGINCLWLQPFFPSPWKDDGYDIADYLSVDPRLGDLGDFVDFIHVAREHGLRVLIDLVVNHTSDRHPWFQSARRDPASPFRDYYIWSPTEPPGAPRPHIYEDPSETVWTFDPVAGEYFYHEFYRSQPDLDIGNPRVREEIRKILGFWLQLGVSGFRIDAAPFLHGKPGRENEDQVAKHLEEFRHYLSWRRGDAVFLAEANEPLDEALEYFAEGPELQMVFSFFMNQQLFLALAREEVAPVARVLERVGEIPPRGQWAHFLRNHDELNLNLLHEREREEVFAAFAPDSGMRLFDRGIRRRLGPMLDGDRRRIELAHSLLFTLPGTPVLRYGDEIGMGDDLLIEGRLSVRTPMQWGPESGAGFSTAPPEKLIRPLIRGGDFGHERLNVASQQLDPGSLLSWMERAIRARHQCPEIGRGTVRVIDTGHPSVLAHTFEWREGRLLFLHNIGGSTARVCLAPIEGATKPARDLLENARAQTDPGRPLELEAYGYRWLRIHESRG